jgi:anti-anti-sigma factor
MQPNDSDFTINNPDSVIDDFDQDRTADVPEGDSGVLMAKPADPSVLKITHDGSAIVIGFNEVQMVDDLCIAGYRDQVFKLLEQNTNCQKLVFNVTNIKFLPSGMLGLMATVKKSGRNVELVNPTAEVREVLHLTRFDEVFTIRFPTA